MTPPLHEIPEQLRSILSSLDKDKILTETTATLFSTSIIWSIKTVCERSTILIKVLIKPKSKIKKIFTKARTYKNEGLDLIQRRILIAKGGFAYYFTEMKHQFNDYRDEVDFGILHIKQKNIGLGEDEINKLVIVFECRHNYWTFWKSMAGSIAIQSIRLKFLPCFRHRNTEH
jgi:hypothetical protein